MGPRILSRVIIVRRYGVFGALDIRHEIGGGQG
jgi:hypothetical protein